VNQNRITTASTRTGNSAALHCQPVMRSVIWRDEPPWYVAECHGIGVVTQGRTLDEVTANLREAVDLYFEDEDPREFGFSQKPVIVVTYELEDEYA